MATPQIEFATLGDCAEKAMKLFSTRATLGRGESTAKSALVKLHLANLCALAAMESVILWVHVVCGVAWVAVCATFVVAAMALSSEPAELSLLAIRTAPRINRLCRPLALVIPITGIGNLFFAARERGQRLPAEFLGILTAKLALLVIMALALWRAGRAAQSIGNEPVAAGDDRIGDSMRELIMFYALIMGAGTIALALGFWLSGT